MQNETNIGRSFVTTGTVSARKSRPKVRLSMLRRMPDFVISAETLASGYSDDVSVDAAWSTVFTATEATADERSYVQENSGE